MPHIAESEAQAQAERRDKATASRVRVLTEQRAFSRFARGLDAMWRLGPLPCALFVFLAWQRAPHEWLALWCGLYGAHLAFFALALRRVLRAGPDAARHTRLLYVVAALDGVVWGLLVPLFIDRSPALDAWIGILLTGVGAANVTAYSLRPRAYRVLLVALGLTATIGLLLASNPAVVAERTLALWGFALAMAVLGKRVSDNAHETVHLHVTNAELAARLAAALKVAETTAATDALTGAPNRRAFEAALALHVAAAKRQTFSLLALDIDHFKQINDLHGHAIGDLSLQGFVERVRLRLRPGDICARLGGEEFAVLLPGASLGVAAEVAERVRDGVAAAPLLGAPVVNASVSIGVAEHVPGEGAMALMERADAASYQAKREGRNRVVCAAESPVSTQLNLQL